MALVKIGKSSGNTRRRGSNPARLGEIRLIPDRRSKGGVRYYDVGKSMGLGNEALGRRAGSDPGGGVVAWGST
jgi:hypothetical protein